MNLRGHEGCSILSDFPETFKQKWFWKVKAKTPMQSVNARRGSFLFHLRNWIFDVRTSSQIVTIDIFSELLLLA